MSKVPDFGWKFDSDTVGSDMKLSNNGRTVEKKNKSGVSYQGSARVNYLLNKETGITSWKVHLTKGYDSMAAAFGVIEKNIFNNRKDLLASSVYLKFIGWGTNTSKSIANEESWGNGKWSLGKYAQNGLDAYLKYDPFNSTLSVYLPGITDEDKTDVIYDIPENVYPFVFSWVETVFTIESNVPYPLDNDSDSGEENSNNIN
eukprot:TRINITY_DN336_c1_g3_i1.p1 TRINITY_DN336_c1_g3~~TRINITY_DN336_c1_g3_i1.p1  ORF type:complete len:202 (+),score=58.51 TRINITY_DN336_c1_g3_i1:95-700(+)